MTEEADEERLWLRRAWIVKEIARQIPPGRLLTVTENRRVVEGLLEVLRDLRDDPHYGMYAARGDALAGTVRSLGAAEPDHSDRLPEECMVQLRDATRATAELVELLRRRFRDLDEAAEGSYLEQSDGRIVIFGREGGTAITVQDDGELIGMGSDDKGFAEAAPEDEPEGAEVEERSETTTVRRTPLLKTEPVQLPAEVGAELTVSVTLGRGGLAPGTMGTFHALAPKGAETISVEVFLVASEHFTIPAGQNPQPLVVPVGDGEPAEAATFSVIRAVGPDDAPATITAQFLYDGRPCGSIARTLVAAGDAEPGEDDEFAVEAGAAVPDLTVVVTPHPDKDDRYEVTVLSPHLLPGKRTGNWAIGGGAAAWIQTGIDGIVNARPGKGGSRTSPKAGSTSDKLLSLGIGLFRAAPECFQTAYWELADDPEIGPPKTILIQSSDARIAWELMVPDRDAEVVANPRPLGVTSAVGRWSVPAPAVDQRVPLDDSIVVWPPSTLTAGETEAKYVSGRYAGTVQTPIDVAALEVGFEDADKSLLHFICHGTLSNGGRFSLLIGEELMEMEHLWISKIRTACLRSNPMVFINACNAGGVAAGIRSVDGFGPMFVSIGARVVIAPMWPANDGVASQFARAFYEMIDLANPRPLASIVSELRAKAYEKDGPDTWAAYCFYGDPNAVAVSDVT